MGFTEAVKSVFSQYATFRGRAMRSEYWFFVLFNAIVAGILGVIGGMIFGEDTPNYLASLWSLAVLLPTLAVTVRRLHDIGKSGLWYLICLIPLVGGIILIVFCATDSQPGPNQYGPNPKGIGNESFFV